MRGNTSEARGSARTPGQLGRTERIRPTAFSVQGKHTLACTTALALLLLAGTPCASPPQLLEPRLGSLVDDAAFSQLSEAHEKQLRDAVVKLEAAASYQAQTQALIYDMAQDMQDTHAHVQNKLRQLEVPGAGQDSARRALLGLSAELESQMKLVERSGLLEDEYHKLFQSRIGELEGVRRGQQMKIQVGVVKRVLADLAMCLSEASAQRASVDKLAAASAPPHDLRQQQAVLAEAEESVGEARQRLRGSMRQLFEELTVRPDQSEGGRQGRDAASEAALTELHELSRGIDAPVGEAEVHAYMEAFHAWSVRWKFKLGLGQSCTSALRDPS